DPDVPLALSASTVDGISGCPLQWFLRREVHADTAPTVRMSFGNVLHALAEEVARTGVTDLDDLMKRLDTVWAEITFDAPWQSAVEREAARKALAAFLVWHDGRPGREVLGAEVPFDVTVETPDEPVRLRGSLDRVERDQDGRMRVVDFKTSKTSVSVGEAEAHPQMATYQVAVEAGALDELPGATRSSGGAELVMLRQIGKDGMPTVRGQGATADTTDPAWAVKLLAAAAARVREERFTPLPSEGCDNCEFRRCCSGRAEGRQVVE
ncbi:MAG TPA: PD-(D/E)XK nuclease family protein, partial [Sporichthya sp.]|nr:PD-(D/E)XK nuclease family protein [Sporichthya sp.]